MGTDEILDLVADNPTIVGVKVTDPNVQKVSALKARSDMLVYTGDDFICWRMLCRGADGAMLAYPMILPETFARMYQLHLKRAVAMMRLESGRGKSCHLSMSVCATRTTCRPARPRSTA